MIETAVSINSFPGCVCANASGRCKADSLIAGRVGTQDLSPRLRLSALALWGLPGPTPRVTFCADKKSPKNRLRGRVFRLPLPLKNPPPTTTQGGRPPPFGYPRMTSALSCFLWILPQVHNKKYVSSSTNRKMYPFNRANGRSIVDRPAADQKKNEIRNRNFPNQKISAQKKESKTLVLAVFRFTFGRPKVNCGARGRIAPEIPGSGPGRPGCRVQKRSFCKR